MDSAIEYEKNARNYLQGRDESLVGYNIVRQWANKLPAESEVIEIACGGGYPVTKELCGAGLRIWAIDSSQTLLSEFKNRFRSVQVKCEKAQDSTFFDKKFDAAIAIGIIFLLSDHEQELLLGRISSVLNHTGNFLFTAPTEIGTWHDLNTGILCSSLGIKKYTAILRKHGLEIRSTIVDVGGNNYYDTVKVA